MRRAIHILWSRGSCTTKCSGIRPDRRSEKKTWRPGAGRGAVGRSSAPAEACRKRSPAHLMNGDLGGICNGAAPCGIRRTLTVKYREGPAAFLQGFLVARILQHDPSIVTGSSTQAEAGERLASRRMSRRRTLPLRVSPGPRGSARGSDPARPRTAGGRCAGRPDTSGSDAPFRSGAS